MHSSDSHDLSHHPSNDLPDDQLNQSHKSPSYTLKITSALLGAILTSVLGISILAIHKPVTPFDVVKTRMQSQVSASGLSSNTFLSIDPSVCDHQMKRYQGTWVTLCTFNSKGRYAQDCSRRWHHWTLAWSFTHHVLFFSGLIMI